jgi:ATP-dependent exoDNAse (exonuclease V) beta subunit
MAPGEQPSIVALPVPKPYEGDEIRPSAILECSSSAVGAFIEWLVRKSDWTVRQGDTRRKVKEEDICILFRRMTSSGKDLSQDYVRSLEARGIQHVLVGSKGLHQREEAAIVRTALRAIEWPDDELSVYAVLRGPLFGIDDATLLKFREQHGRLRVFDEPSSKDPEFHPVWDALRILRELHRERNHKPVADTMRRLLGAVRGHAIFAFHGGGARRLANLHRIAELARRSEDSSSISFRAFVRWLEEEAESGETAEAPVLEQQAGGVRLMTVHKAKGLEFPVVILADPSAGLTSHDGCSRWVDSKRGLCAQRLLKCAPWELIDHEAEEEAAEREEAVRVAYVAATRPKDLLVVCAVGDTENQDWWLSPLYDVLYPEKRRRTNNEEAPGCPRVGNETVLNAPLQSSVVQIRPGAHRPRAGKHKVAWFDPAVLRLQDPPSQGAEREHLLHGNPSQIAEGLALYRAWQARRGAAIAEGSRPRLVVQRVTEAGEIVETEAIPVEVVGIKTGVQQPAGRRYGKLLHAVLQTGGSAEVHGRRLDATPEEVKAAAETARVVLAHPLVAASGREVFRELPIVVRLNDGSLLEGRVDLARTDGREWTVVDYKTDSADRRRYRRQLQMYGLALQRATGKAARGILLEIGR